MTETKSTKPRVIKAQGKAVEQPETIEYFTVFYRNKGRATWRSLGADLFETEQQAIRAVTTESVAEIATLAVTLPNPLLNL